MRATELLRARLAQNATITLDVYVRGALPMARFRVADTESPAAGYRVPWISAIPVLPVARGEIIHGRRSITADTDLRLCTFFGLSRGYWLRAQAAHDTEVAEEKLAAELAKIRPWAAAKELGDLQETAMHAAWPEAESNRDSVREHLLLLARRYVWWKDPQDAVRDRHHLIAQVMTLGTLEDCVWLEEVLGREELVEAIEQPAIGVFTPRAWHYWHYRLRLAATEHDIPALPTRRYA